MNSIEYNKIGLVSTELENKWELPKKLNDESVSPKIKCICSLMIVNKQINIFVQKDPR